MSVLPEHRTANSRIVAALERPDNPAMSVGKEGLGNILGSPAVQAIIMALGGVRGMGGPISRGVTSNPRPNIPIEPANQAHRLSPFSGGSQADNFSTSSARNWPHQLVQDRDPHLGNPHLLEGLSNPAGIPTDRPHLLYPLGLDPGFPTHHPSTMTFLDNIRRNFPEQTRYLNNSQILRVYGDVIRHRQTAVHNYDSFLNALTSANRRMGESGASISRRGFRDVNQPAPRRTPDPEQLIDIPPLPPRGNR